MEALDKLKAWKDRWKGTNLWDVLAILHRLWDRGRDIGYLPEQWWQPTESKR